VLPALLKCSMLDFSVELAAVVQKADEFTRATAGAKLSIIAEQVPDFCILFLDFFLERGQHQFTNRKIRTIFGSVVDPE
jgi:hypothetical protein